MRLVAFAALAMLGPVQAADPTGAMLWAGADFQKVKATLLPKMDSTKAASQSLMTEKNYNALVFHREGNAEVEIHQKMADFLVILGGSGSMMVGGTIKGAHPAGTNEIRGTALEGGMTYELSAGDVLYIPANVPHHTMVGPGEKLDVMVIKVQPQS